MRNLIKTALLAKSLRAGGPGAVGMYVASRFLKGRTVMLLTLGGMAARWWKNRSPKPTRMEPLRSTPAERLP